MSFPFGFFGWKVTGLTPGQAITVTIVFPAPVASPAQYWKVIAGNWTNVTSLVGSDNGDAILTLTITDGGLGDADGIANGEISDPGGVGVGAASTPCAVSGAGSIDRAQPKYFALAARYQAGAARPEGSLAYADAGARQYLRTLTITKLTCSGTHATITGTGVTPGGSVAFTAELDDRAAGAGGDAFAIQWPGYQVSKPLAFGETVVRIR
jgi:hypothetical protein